MSWQPAKLESSTYATMVQENSGSVSAGSDLNVNHTLSKTGDPSGTLKPLHGSLPVAIGLHVALSVLVLVPVSKCFEPEKLHMYCISFKKKTASLSRQSFFVLPDGSRW